MRLTEREKETILECVTRYFGHDSVVTLFGSRTDDSKRGGDIDLHVIAGRLQPVDLLTEIRCKLELEEALDDQEIDLIVRRAGSPQQPFDTLVKAKGVVL